MSLVQDFRFAARIILKKPWFSAAIVATLAFGMGVNTTVFSLVNAVIRRSAFAADASAPECSICSTLVR